MGYSKFPNSEHDGMFYLETCVELMMISWEGHSGEYLLDMTAMEILMTENKRTKFYLGKG